MGFDVMGINPKNKEGEYFRNNIWWWGKLWVVCCYLLNDDDGKVDLKKGFHNDGLEIKGDIHKKLVGRLKEVLDNPILCIELEKCLTPKGEEDCRQFDIGNVRNFYEFISNNKGFAIW